jgi:diguanylate cyclase (GGDEF)-like protein
LKLEARVTNLVEPDGPDLRQEVQLRRHAEAELVAANLRLTEALETLAERTLDMELFNHFSEQLLRCESLEDACAEAVRTGMELFASASGRILLLPLGGSGLTEAGAWTPRGATFPAVLLDAVLAINPPATNLFVVDGALGVLRAVMPTDVDACLVIPLFVRSELHGVFQIAPGQVGLSRRAAVATYSKHLAMALSNIRLRERLRDQSLRDPLTRLFNRRYFEEAFSRELKRSERHQIPLSVVMLDIDFFKRINDTYGHDVGDDVLRGLASVIAGLVRTEDTVCRLGGEEFVVLLPSTSTEQGLQAAEKLRAAVRGIKFRELAGLNRISCSFGVATFPEHGMTGEALLHAADMALYRAKHGGRDRVEAAVLTDRAKP